MKHFLFLFFSVLLPLAAAEETFRIVTLGDSITKGVRSGVRPEETFSALLQEALQKEGLSIQVDNLGIGGERTDQALKRLERSVVGVGARLVTVMYGTNDSWVDAGKTESRLAEEAYEANLRELIKRLAAAKIQPVLMTEPMFSELNRKNGLGEDPNLRLSRYMERCRTVAREMQVPLVDHFNHWAGAQKAGQKLQDWTTDGCHPNPEGHAEMARTILKRLLPLLRPEVDAPQPAAGKTLR